MSAGVTPNPSELRRQSVNRKSYFTPSNKKTEEDDDDEAPAAKLRKAMTFKLRQEGQKKHRRSFFNKIFESPKATDRKDEEVGKSDIFDNFNEEKIDIVEIPTKVIENFTQKMSRGNSRERGMNPRVHSEFVDLDRSPVPTRKNPPLRSFPNVRGGSPVEEKFTPSFGIQPKLDSLVKEKEKTLQDSQYSLGKAESVDSKEYQISDQVSDNSPPKVVVIDGMTFNKKASITKDKKTGSPQSAGGDAHEEDEIPGIALAVAKSEANNRKYRLSIYNAPNTEHEAGKVLRNLWGAASNTENAGGSNASSSDSDDDSESSKSNSNSNQSNVGKVPDEIKMKEEPEAGEYKIRIISPESSFQPKENQTVQDSEFKNIISEPPVLLNFGTPSQGNSEFNTHRNPSIGSNLFEIPKDKSSNSIDSDQNTKQGQKTQSSLAVPLLRINSNDANNLSLIGGEEESAGAEENNRKVPEESKPQEISPEKNQSMKWKEMSPPAIITNTYWKKKIFDFHQKANQVDGDIKKETEVPLKKVGSEEKKSKKEKSRKNQKIESNKYKKKYRKQSKYIKELLSGFKDIRKEFGDMKGDVMSIQGRLDNFEKLMDNLQGLITVFANKVREKNQEKKEAVVPDQQDTKESSSTQVELKEPTSVPNRDDSLSATVYLPQKKTIVFSFQKPQVSSSSSRARKGGETLQSMPEEEKERLSDSSLELIAQNKDDMMKEIPKPPVRSSPNKDVMKPSMRRIPKLKLEGSKAGFEILDDKSSKYQKNEETDKFL